MSKMFAYDVTENVSHETNEIADALSRAPVFPANASNTADFVDVCEVLTL